MKPLDEKIEEARQIYQEAVEEFQVNAEIALFSGGDDSLVSTHWMMEDAGADKVVHLDTGIAIPQTHEYVRETCDQFGWDLEFYAAKDYVRGDGTPDPQSYEEFVLERGFPGPPMHWKMFQRLKERPTYMVVRDHKDGWYDKVILGTGRYRSESNRRMRLSDEEIDRDGAAVWVNPLFHWKSEHFRQYRKRHDLPRNPVAEKLCMSGECLCGAFASPGELLEICALYPKVGERILDLQEKVYEQGFDWGWEERPEDAENREEPPDDFKARLCAGCIPEEDEPVSPDEVEFDFDISKIQSAIEQGGSDEPHASKCRRSNIYRPCPLAGRIQNRVFGSGSMVADLMFVGEAPGEKEDEQGLPFVGPSGNLLDQMLERLGRTRSDVFITNLIQCRPPNNRKPREDELACCRPMLEQKIRYVDPEILVALGSTAKEELDSYDLGFSHPAYALRNNDESYWITELAERIEKAFDEDSVGR